MTAMMITSTPFLISQDVTFYHIEDDNGITEKINIMKKRLKKSRIIKFEETEHEIFMEKDIHREKMWNAIDKFLQ